MHTQSVLCCPICNAIPELLFEKIEGEMVYSLGCSHYECEGYAYAFRLSMKDFPLEEVVENWNGLDGEGDFV
jgi:hypothetical protein